jgi:hypothetical protein
MNVNRRAMDDFREHSPTRSDGFMVPAADSRAFDPAGAALLSLAGRAPSPRPAPSLRNFLGGFHCCKCGTRGPMHAVRKGTHL